MDMFLKAFSAIATASVRPPTLPLGAWLGFGILIPIRHGVDFLDARMILAYAFIPMLFVASPVAAGMTFARQSSAILSAWLSAAVAFGWCVGFIFLTTAIVTVNVVFRLSPIQWPEAGVLRLYSTFCLSAVWFVTVLSAYLAVLFTPNVARQIMRVGFLVLLVILYVGPRALPPQWQFELGQIEPRQGAAWTSWILALAAAGLSNALRFIVPTTPAPTAAPPPSS